MNLESYIADLEAKRAQGVDTPDGGAYGDGAIETITTDRGVIRRAYRNYAILEEKDGGVYVLPDATGLARFRS